MKKEERRSEGAKKGRKKRKMAKGKEYRIARKRMRKRGICADYHPHKTEYMYI